MVNKKKSRKFPYYVIYEVKDSLARMKVVDLNTIQKKILVDDTIKNNQRDSRYQKERFVYEDDIKKHVAKEMDIPGSNKTEQAKIVKFVKDMDHPNYMMVFDSRRGTIHEEYKVNAFREFEDKVLHRSTSALVEAEIEADTVEEDEKEQ